MASASTKRKSTTSWVSGTRRSASHARGGRDRAASDGAADADWLAGSSRSAGDSASTLEDGRNAIENVWFLERREIARIVSGHNCSQSAAHDLRTARLRERRDEHDALRRKALAERR